MSNGKQTLFIVILLCSLAFNIFLSGFLVGNYLARGRGHPPPGHHPLGQGPFEPGLGMVGVLPEASQDKIAPLVQQQKTAMRSQKQQIKQAQQAVFAQLTAANFNSQAFLEALTHLQQEKNQAQQIMGQFLAEVARQLPQEERQRLAEAMRSRPPPPPPPLGHEFPPPPPPEEME